MTCNYAENQERWDRGEVTLEACYRKGQEHRAYGFSSCLGFPASPEQLTAYKAGTKDQPFPFNTNNKEDNGSRESEPTRRV